MRIIKELKIRYFMMNSQLFLGKKIQWGMPGGIPTARRAFYVGSVG